MPDPKPLARAAAVVLALALLVPFWPRPPRPPPEPDPGPDADATLAAYCARAAAKEAVGREVAAGRLSLRGAVARYRTLDARGPVPRYDLGWGPRGRSRADRLCGQVIT